MPNYKLIVMLAFSFPVYITAGCLKQFIRTIGLARAEVKIGLMNLTYNLMCYLQLTKGRTGVPALV